MENRARRPRVGPMIEPLDPRVLLTSVPLHVNGTVLSDPGGNSVRLRGVDIDSLEYNINGDHITQSLDTALHTWHANLIRLPMNENFWYGYDYNPTPLSDGGAAYRAMIDQVVNTVEQNNAYVVLDLHWSNAGVWGANNGQHRMPDDASTQFWHDVATRYANNPAVFFDPYNEPHDIDWPTWRNGGTLSEVNSSNVTITYHSPGMQGLLDTIRATGADNIVAASGTNWAANFSGILTGYALDDPAQELMYQAHLYPYDSGGQTNAQRDAIVSAVAARYPLYVGEFGTDNTGSGSHFTGQPTADQWTQTMIAWLDQHRYNWTAWSFNPSTTPVLISDWNYTPTSYYGIYVKNSLAQPVIGPRVTGVSVSGPGWINGFASIPAGADQLADLPWGNIDRIRVTFDRNVNLTRGSLSLTGISVPTYTVSGFTYSASTLTATWTLAQPIGADHLQLSLANVRDSFGFVLDGDWTDGQSAFPSGDGSAGGGFTFHFNVLPGDVNRDGGVNFNDLLLLAQSYGSSNAPADDLDGDGAVDFADLLVLAQNYGAGAASPATATVAGPQRLTSRRAAAVPRGS